MTERASEFSDHADFVSAPEVEFHDWVIGNLALSLCWLVDVVGPDADVLAIRLSEPLAARPLVEVVVPDSASSLRLRERAAEVDGISIDDVRGALDGWSACLCGSRLLVTLASSRAGARPVFTAPLSRGGM